MQVAALLIPNRLTTPVSLPATNPRRSLLDTQKTRSLCGADTDGVEDWRVMQALKLSSLDSDLPTRPINERPVPRFEPVPSGRTHLMLVRTPKPTPRSLAWARRKNAEAFDAGRLESMLRSERLNLG